MTRIPSATALTILQVLIGGSVSFPASADSTPPVSPAAQAQIDAAAIATATYNAEAQKQAAIKAQIDNAKDSAGAFPTNQPGKTTLGANGLDHTAQYVVQRNLIETGRKIGNWAKLSASKTSTLIVVTDSGLGALTQVGRDTQFTLNLLLNTMKSEVGALGDVERAAKAKPAAPPAAAPAPAAPGGQAPVPQPNPAGQTAGSQPTVEGRPAPSPFAIGTAVAGAAFTAVQDIASTLRANYAINNVQIPTDLTAVFAGIAETACGTDGKTCFVAPFTAMPLTLPLNGCLRELDAQQVALSVEIGKAQILAAQYPKATPLSDEITNAISVLKSYGTAITALTAPPTGGGPSTLATASTSLALLFSAAGVSDTQCSSIAYLSISNVHILVVHSNEIGGSVVLEDETIWHNPRASRQGTSVISAFLVDGAGGTYGSMTVDANSSSFVDIPWEKDASSINNVEIDTSLTSTAKR